MYRFIINRFSTAAYDICNIEWATIVNYVKIQLNTAQVRVTHVHWGFRAMTSINERSINFHISNVQHPNDYYVWNEDLKSKEYSRMLLWIGTASFWFEENLDIQLFINS